MIIIHNLIYMLLLLVNKVLNIIKIILENSINLKTQLNKLIGLIKKHLLIGAKILNYNLKHLLFLILKNGIIMLASIFNIINKNHKNGQKNGENYNLLLINN